MDVSVIIVNYNTLELTKNTIESIFEKTQGVRYEIILVDNASKDGSIEFFESNYKDKIIFIKNNENLGFGKANNKGIEVAKGEYIFLLNSDTLLLNNAIKYFYEYMKDEKNKKVGVITCQALDKDKKIIPFNDTPITYLTAFTEEIENILKILKLKKDSRGIINKDQELGYACGAILFTRKKILDEIGTFDEQFFMYYEETDLQLRIRKKGYKIYNILGPNIIHFEGQSNKVSHKKRLMITESKIKFLRKYNGTLKIIIYKGYILFLVFLKILFKNSYTYKENIEYLKKIIRS